MVSFLKQKLYDLAFLKVLSTFLIYINDLNNALDKCIVHRFADDTNVTFGNKCPSETSSVINNEQKLLTDWLRATKLSWNESKTKLIIFIPCRKLNITVLNIKLNKFILTPKDLSLILVLRLMKTFCGTKKLTFLQKKLSKTNSIF